MSSSLFPLAHAKQQQSITQRSKDKIEIVLIGGFLDTQRLLVTLNGICVMFIILSSVITEMFSSKFLTLNDLFFF